MIEHREEHLELCAAYAVGSIDPGDRESLARHVAGGCPLCEAALADFGAATVLLAASAPAATPSASLRDRVLAAARDEAPAAATGPGHASVRDDDRASNTARDESHAHGAGATDDAPAAAEAPEPPSFADLEGPPRARPARVATEPRARVLPVRPATPLGIPLGGWMAAAAGFAVTTLIFGLTTLQLSGALRAARGEVDSNRDALAALNQRLEETRRWSDVLSAPGARTASLAPTPDGLALGRARATYDPATKRAVIVFDGLQAPQGKVFELWAITGAGPASLGLVQTDSFGRAVVHIDDAGDPNTLNAFAVSLENPGGSTNPRAPSGPVVMLGRVEG